MVYVSHLCVTEEKHNRVVIEPSLLHASLYVFPPFCYAVVLGQLYLKAVILSPVQTNDK